MRKLVIVLVFFAAVLASRPAEACRNGSRCPFILDAMAVGLGAAMIGGYAYGTGYYAYHDLTDETQTMKYGAGELAYNGAFGALLTYGVVNAAADGDVKTTLIVAPLALAHDAMAVHGAWRIKEEWKDPGHAPDNTREWIAGIAYGANTLVWTFGLGDDHGRTYGIVEAAVNAPVAAGLGYLAIDRIRDGERGMGLLFGGMAALSGAFTYHGITTAISPAGSKPLDLLGTDVMPTAVSDGREVAPGLGMSGTW
jgi:hypothetical protein